MSAVNNSSGLVNPFSKSSPLQSHFEEKGAFLQSLKTQSVVQKSKIGDLFKAALTSRIIRASVISTVTILVSHFVFQFTLPQMITVALVVLVTTTLFPNPLNAKKELLFELGNFKRLFFEKNFHPIKIGDKDTNILLGAMPNRIKNDAIALQKEGVASVISLNEDWERRPRASLIPYQAEHYKYFGIHHYHQELVVEDRLPLQNEQAEVAAKFIFDQLTENPNKKVYVHCKAGRGRSAYAVAAYLIKYRGMSADEAVKAIKESRPSTTIHKTKKVEALKKYEVYCKQLQITKT